MIIDRVEPTTCVLDGKIAALLDENIPAWAIARTNGEYVLGAKLTTRDNKRMSNAHIIRVQHITYGVLYTIVTDAGGIGQLTAIELEECYYPPKYVVDVTEVIRNFLGELE